MVNIGYKLTVSNNYLVPVIKSGVVVFIGTKKDYGNVVTIEAEDNTTITYGNIKNTKVIEKGEPLFMRLDAEEEVDYLQSIMKK